MKKEIGLWIIVLLVLVTSIVFGKQETMAIDFTGVLGQKIDYGDVITDVSQKSISFWTYIDSDATMDYVSKHQWGVYRSILNNSIVYIQNFSTDYGQWKSANDSLQPGSYYHIVITYDNSSDANDPIFYVNSEISAISSEKSPSGTYSSDSGRALVIGSANSGGITGAQNSPDGRVLDFRIYNRILTADEVLQIYSARGRDNIRNGLVFCPFLLGAAGLQAFDGATLAAGNTIVDPCSGAVGTPAGEPIGVGETYLVR